MNLIINCSNNLSGGGLQVALSFIEECKHVFGNKYYVLLNETFIPLIDSKEFPDNFEFHFIKESKFWKISKELDMYESTILPDAVFSIFSPVYWRPKVLHVAGFANGYYIYPDSPFWSQISLMKKLKLKLKKILHWYYIKRDIDVLIVETEDAKYRLKKFISGKKYYSVSNTCSSVFDKINSILPDRIEKVANDTSIKILALSKFYPHKNLLILNRVVEILRLNGYSNIKFILTIDDAIYEESFCRTGNIINVGPLNPHDCPSLYDACDFVIVPSLLECFTANFPEAMKMDKPILASDLSYAKDICHNAALYFNPLSPEDIANKIQYLINNVEVQKRLVSNGNIRFMTFPSALQRAEQYLDIIKKNIQ